MRIREGVFGSCYFRRFRDYLRDGSDWAVQLESRDCSCALMNHDSLHLPWLRSREAATGDRALQGSSFGMEVIESHDNFKEQPCMDSNSISGVFEAPFSLYRGVFQCALAHALFGLVIRRDWKMIRHSSPQIPFIYRIKDREGGDSFNTRRTPDNTKMELQVG